MDLSDQRNLFGSNELHEVDVYVKRSFWPSAIAGRPASVPGKIQPFGLGNPAISRQNAASLLLSRLRIGRGPIYLFRDLWQLLALPNPKSLGPRRIAMQSRS